MRISDWSSDVCSSDLAVGEGHISSIAFREAILTPRGGFDLAPEPPFATAVNSIDDEATSTDGPVEVFRHVEANLSGTVIFPMTPAQRNGLEDLRPVRSEHEDGELEWLGNYTAIGRAQG